MILNAFVYARRYAGVVIAIALCLSVCLSFCVCHKSVLFYRNVWTDRVVFQSGGFFDLFYTVLLANRGIYKNKDASIWNFVPSSGLKINLARKKSDAYQY